MSDEARRANGNLPGMGGVYNVVNLHLYHYAGNNPIKYTDPDGRQSMYLPSGGTIFNGPASGMKYDMQNYSNESKVIGDYVEGITLNGNAVAIIIDKLFLGGEFKKRQVLFR